MVKEQIIFLQQAVNSPTQQEQVGPSGVGESNWAKVFSLNIPIQRESWSGCIFPQCILDELMHL